MNRPTNEMIEQFDITPLSRIQDHTDFLNTIRTYYRQARHFDHVTQNQVMRATNRSISHLFEDLFAAYCANLLPKDESLLILIDPQISFTISGLRNHNDTRPLLFRPDVCFLKCGVVTKVFEVKTDIGYKRTTFNDYAKELATTIGRIKGLECTITVNGDKKFVSISKSLEHVIIILNGAENSGNIEEAKKLIKEQYGINLLTLSNGMHLNNKFETCDIKISSDFMLLDALIQQ